MKLTLEIPINYWDEFYPLCDFDYALAHLLLTDKTYFDFYKNHREKTRPLWIDNGFNENGKPVRFEKVCALAEALEATHVFADEHLDPRLNLKKILFSRQYLLTNNLNFNLISVYRGGVKMLEAEHMISDLISLPFDSDRSQIFSKGYNSKDYHYLGFKTLDELKTYPPASIDTSVPFRAALRGLDLTTLQRRPKILPPFETTMLLNPAQRRLAKHNILSIKEACYGV